MLSFSSRSVDFANTNSFSPLILDYLSSPGSFEKFFSNLFSEKAFPEAIRKRSVLPVNRTVLQAVIREQYKKLAGKITDSTAVDRNISLLEKPETYTVTTGHQLNLFTGPVYFIYKIISTINLAAKLSKSFPQHHFVPVYWLASEDHDQEEINHIYLFGKKIEWKPPVPGAAGRVPCTGICEIIDSLKGMLPPDPNSEKILSLFSKAYHEKNNLSEATRIIVHELFSSYGLVSLDADDARLKKLFVNEMKDDVVNHSAFRLVEKTIGELEKKYKAQVHPREINLFYLGENSRERIVEENNLYRVLNREIKFSKEELLLELETHPEKFSPNVVLRPLYQEKILPNLAYVGGPAEISYWLEYKTMFEHYKADLPVLVVRSSFMIVDAMTRDKLKKLGLEPEDTFLGEDDLVKKYLKIKSSGEFSDESLLKMADSVFNETLNKVRDIDPTLTASVEAEKQKMINGLKGLAERIRRAEKKKHETAVNQVRKLRQKLFPENKLQERYENVLTFYSKYGDDFLTGLIGPFDPFEKKFIVQIEN